jgi:hypothetical protein
MVTVQAVATAKASNKWLLVNIQRDEDFESWQLNRDTWKVRSCGRVGSAVSAHAIHPIAVTLGLQNDAVEGIISTGFIFWQQAWTIDKVSLGLR